MHRTEDASRVDLTSSTYLTLSARLFWSELATLLPATISALVIASPWLAAVAFGVGALAPLACALFGAPAWAGLVAVTAIAARGDSAGIRTMLHAVRRNYRRAVALGAMTAGFAWAFERMLAGTGDNSVVLIPVLAITSAATFVVLAIDLYAFTLLELHNAPLRDTIRGALALAAAAPGPTLGLLAAGALAYFSLAWLGPGTLLLSLPGLAVLQVNNTLLQVERLDPTPEETRE
jgi:hypothetical protein